MPLSKLKVVAIGGGHGLGKVLSSLSSLGNRLTGIVTTTDNGGSTGRLRKRSSSIAWGDMRNCLTQLVDPDSVGSQLFNFRFEGDDELGGHNLGNLILYGLGEIHSRPLESIDLIRRLLRVKTRILPMSETPTDLIAFYAEGRCRVGELSVDQMPVMPKNLMLAPLVKTLPECIDAISCADVILLGPGSFLTSVVPPLLVREISATIKDSKAQCIFIENVVSEHSPAAELSLDAKLTWLEENVGFDFIDSVICQTSDHRSKRYHCVQAPLRSKQTAHHHSSEKLIQALEQCINEFHQQQLLKPTA